MALINLFSADEVRGLQTIIRERVGEDGLPLARVVQNGAGQSYELVAWDTATLGELPTLQQIRNASTRYRAPEDSPTRDLLTRIKAIETRLDAAGL